VLGLDVYTMRTRLAPALLTAAPALALGIAALPLLPGVHRFWTLVALGLATFASLVARAAGNRVQMALFEIWGGMPTTSRLRFADAKSTAEIQRRHNALELVLGDVTMPSEPEESADPRAADSEYEAAMKRIVARVRNSTEYPLLNQENRNYGFSRNLLGLKRMGVLIALGTAAISVGAFLLLGALSSWTAAMPLVLAIVVSVAALGLWPQVGPDMVKPSAEAYADRIIDAVYALAEEAKGGSKRG
jgi:hypothetical protein